MGVPFALSTAEWEAQRPGVVHPVRRSPEPLDFTSIILNCEDHTYGEIHPLTLVNFGSRIALILQCWNFISAERQSHHIPHLLCPWGPAFSSLILLWLLKDRPITGNTYGVLVLLWPVSLGITSSRFTMRSHMGFPSILRLSNSPLYVCNIPHMISFIGSSIDE